MQMCLKKIWNVTEGLIKIWTKVHAELEVWYFVPVSSTHTLAQTNEL